MSVQEITFTAVSNSIPLGCPRQTRQQKQSTAELRSPSFLVDFASRSEEIKYCQSQSGCNTQGIWFYLI